MNEHKYEYKLYEIKNLDNYYFNLNILDYKDKYYISVYCEVGSFKWKEIQPNYFKALLRNKQFDVVKHCLYKDRHYKYEDFITSLKELDKVMNLKEKGDN